MTLELVVLEDGRLDSRPFNKNGDVWEAHIPLSKEDFLKIKEGNHLIFPFYRELQPLPIYAFVVGIDKALKKDVEFILESGDTVLNVGLGEKGIEEIEKAFETTESNSILASYPENIQVHIFPDTWLEHLKEKK